MLAITVELLHGTYRADPTGLAHTGQQSEGEWPPSPLRLFAALVAADGTGDRCRVTNGDELSFLELAPPPTIEASPPNEVCHQRLEPRYVVVHTGSAASGSAHQEYQARRGGEIRPGVRVAPRSPVVRFRWDVDVPADVLRGLHARAARVGYLGTADSPVAVTVSVDHAPPADGHTSWVPDAHGDAAVRAPQPGVLAAMDAHHERWVEGGASVHRSQSPGLRRLVRYRSPDAPPAQPPSPHRIWLRFDRSVSGRRVSAVTSTLKAAVLDQYQRRFGEPPEVLHGHVDDPARPHRLTLFVALPDVGHLHACGMIHGAVLELPPETPAAVVESCRAVLHELDELVGPGFRTATRLAGDGRQPAALRPARWLRPATRYGTAFPALHERRGVPLTLTELSRWCEHAGLPAPVAARSARAPFLSGGVDLVPREVNRPGKAPRPYSHLELVFEEPVTGLVVVGAGRTRGLGLCAPIAEVRS